jgi:3-oxoacyl-[acyl-carrier-protein] synthase II
MRRVVITGIGVVAPIGVGVARFWEAALSGRNGVRPVTSFDTSECPAHYAGEVLDFRIEQHVSDRATAHLGRASQFALACAYMAVADATLTPERLNPRRCGVIMGTTVGEADTLHAVNAAWLAGGIEAVPQLLLRRYPYHMAPAVVAAALGFTGTVTMVPNACSAGNHALGYAADLIREGRADVMLAGGADAFSRSAFLGFAVLHSMARERCQPFDLDRQGMIVSEGAALLVLESLEHARGRDAPIYAELAAYALGCDAHHITGPDPEARGAVQAMTGALAQAGLDGAAVDYVSAHGTGTPANDRAEALAMRRVFGERGRRLPISSIKSMIGHTLGTASAIEAAVCALAVSRGAVPPTINFETPDPECDVDCVPNTARDMPVRVALSNSFAFGGNCACLAVKAIDGDRGEWSAAGRAGRAA